MAEQGMLEAGRESMLAPSMAEQAAIRVCRDNVEAFSTGDWQRFKETLTPDCVYQEFATQRRVQGVDALVQLSQGWREAFPDARGTITNALARGDTVVLEITWEGTQTGPLMGPSGTLPASGRRVTLPACQVITVQNDKIEATRHYFDMMGMLQQLGALPH